MKSEPGLARLGRKRSRFAVGFLNGEEAPAQCQTSEEYVIRKGRILLGIMIKVSLWRASISGQTKTNTEGHEPRGARVDERRRRLRILDIKYIIQNILKP